MTKPFNAAAYGGAGWSPRTTSLRQEIGTVWGTCGVATEWSPLRAVLLHRPGGELDAVADPDAVQMLAPLDIDRARRQHDALAQAYRDAGVAVHYVEPAELPPPNLMFVADLLFMTPEGAIVGRPASTVRAGEERFIARRLAELGIPILRSVRGDGTFEGADAAWMDPRTVVLATALRTNDEGSAQVASLLREMAGLGRPGVRCTARSLGERRRAILDAPRRRPRNRHYMDEFPEDLIQQARRGNREATELLCVRTMAFVRRLLGRSGVDGTTVDDLVQDTAIRVLRDLPATGDGTCFRAVVVRSVRDVLAASWRSQRRAPTLQEARAHGAPPRADGLRRASRRWAGAPQATRMGPSLFPSTN